jgi:hypothetical protein
MDLVDIVHVRVQVDTGHSILFRVHDDLNDSIT